MTKQVLDVQQMQHLQELGMELKKDTILVWARFMLGKTQISDWEIAYNHSAITDNSQTIPAYTLQDVLDALPESILKNDIQYWLSICRVSISIWMISYSDDVDLTTNLHHEEYESLIDAAYSMLCWAIENGYVETNKNE